MSISTTAGGFLGIASSASSPDACWLTSSKPLAREIRCARCERISSSSSTIETRNGEVWSSRAVMCDGVPRMASGSMAQRCNSRHERRLTLRFEGDGHGEQGAVPRLAVLALNSQAAANAAQALFHVLSPVPGSRAWGIRSGPSQSAPVVLNADGEFGPLGLQSNPDLARVRVPQDVVERFLGGEEDVVTHFRREEAIGQFRRYFEMALDSCVCEMLARKLANVTGQVLERVVLRVDGPDDLIHFAHHLTGRRGKFLRLRADLLTFVFNAIGPQVVLQQFTEHGDFHHAGPQAIVHVAGDAGAFAFKGLLPFEGGHATAVFSNRLSSHDPREADHKKERTGGGGPPCAPPRG